MTARTKASLLSDLSSGASSDGSVETTLIRDIVDSLALDTDVSSNTTAISNLTDGTTVPLMVEQVLFTLASADMNVDTDQSFTKRGTFANYIITEIRAHAASADLTTAAGGVYQAASKAGDALVAASQAYTALDAATKGLSLTLTAFAKDVLTATPILSLTTPQGGAATAAFYVIGIPLTRS